MNTNTTESHPLTPAEASRASWLNEMQREFSRRQAELEAGRLPAPKAPTRIEAHCARLDRRMRRLFP
jgi:hypothetical protein